MFADKLKELRKKKGVTQAQLADAIYVSRSLIAKFETGASYPNKDTLEKIALYFGISVSELVGTDETVLIAVENKNLTQRIEFWSLVVILAVAFVFAIMVFVPPPRKQVCLSNSTRPKLPREGVLSNEHLHGDL